LNWVRGRLLLLPCSGLGDGEELGDFSGLVWAGALLRLIHGYIGMAGLGWKYWF